VLGASRAFEWMTSNRKLTAAEAHAWGLVSEVVESESLLARAAERITVRDVYEAVEGPILLCRCRQRVEPCGDEACDTHAFWNGVETLLTEELQTVTFAALADSRRQAPGTSGRPQATRR